MGCAVFDLDGTLIDSCAAIAAVGDALMRELDLAPLPAEEGRKYIGEGGRRFLEQALEARDQQTQGPLFEARHKRFMQLYTEAPTDLNKPFIHVEDTLNMLKGKGFSLGVCTNKPGAPTHKILRALGWADLFDAVVAGDDLPQRKPDAAPLRACVEQIGAPLTAFVGDSEIDAGAAVNYKARFLLFTEGYRKSPVESIPHDDAFNDYRMLPKLLGL